MKRTGFFALCCMTLLLLSAVFSAGCVSEDSPVVSPTDSEFIGTWTLNGTFLANGELCDVTVTFRPDGTGLREFIAPATGETLTAENLTWNRTGEFDNVKIRYEDGLEENMSLGWLKGTW